MSKKRKANRAKKIGLPPGSLVYFGEKEKLLDIDVISYSDTAVHEQKVGSAQEALSLIKDNQITWININGLNNIEEIRKIGNYTQLNNLLLEDVLDTQHRPKVELLDEHLLVIINMLYYQKGELIAEHLALLLGRSYLITFQESEGGDVFDPIRKLLQAPESLLRKSSADYLLFALLDSIVDNYLAIVDRVSDAIESIEDYSTFKVNYINTLYVSKCASIKFVCSLIILLMDDYILESDQEALTNIRPLYTTITDLNSAKEYAMVWDILNSSENKDIMQSVLSKFEIKVY